MATEEAREGEEAGETGEEGTGVADGGGEDVVANISVTMATEVEEVQIIRVELV